MFSIFVPKQRIAYLEENMWRVQEKVTLMYVLQLIFLFQLNFVFPLFFCYSNEFETKKKQNLTEIKNYLQHM